MTVCDIDAKDFLEAIFFNYDEAVETPVLGQTRKRPSDGETVFWAYRLPDADLSEMHHASLALQQPTEPHQTSRKANFTGGIGVVLDDVFEKVPEPVLTPTWRMETKPGSEQWGYLFEKPLRDAVLHDQIIRALTDNGLSDPGMKNVVRWFRLPGSQPLGKRHAARLTHWKPERRFPHDQLLKQLGVSSLPKPRSLATPLPDFKPHDIVFDWLEKSGHLRNTGGDNWWEITCPWAHEHSDSDTRAYYLPRGGPNARRGFNCFHSHAHKIEDFLEWVAKNGGPKANVEDLPSWRLPVSSDETALSNDRTKIELSQDALAKMMGEQGWDEDARYVASWNKWLFWNGVRWHLDERLSHMTRTREFMRSVAREMMRQAEQMGKGLAPSEAKKLLNKAKRDGDKLRDKHVISATELLARSNPVSVANPDDFDADPMLLGTPDGTVDLRTGKQRAAQRAELITKLTRVAPASQGSAPRLWLKFLNEIFDGDQDIVAFMQRAAGYALTGDVSEHKLLFLYGGGRNGKSVFLNTLFDIWGDYSRRAASATFLNSQQERHPTDVAGLQGARLVAGSELPVGKTWDESVIKNLTGGDVMTARFMRGDFFDFMPQLTLIIAGNNQPSFRGVDEAIRARVVLVPFNVTIPERQRDPDLQKKLMAEAPEILSWAIDGALQWQKQGLNVPAVISAASSEYFDAEDTVARFLADETVDAPGNFISSTALHSRFASWCVGEGLTPFTQLTLIKDIRKRGYEDAKSGSKRGLKGLALKLQDERAQMAAALRPPQHKWPR